MYTGTAFGLKEVLTTLTGGTYVSQLDLCPVHITCVYSLRINFGKDTVSDTNNKCKQFLEYTYYADLLLLIYSNLFVKCFAI